MITNVIYNSLILAITQSMFLWTLIPQDVNWSNKFGKYTFHILLLEKIIYKSILNVLKSSAVGWPTLAQ